MQTFRNVLTVSTYLMLPKDIRPAVIWRRTSFGSQTQTGSNFVSRMLTVVTTLKSQRRNVLDFMTAATSAARIGKPAPSLLPEVTVYAQVINAT